MKKKFALRMLMGASMILGGSAIAVSAITISWFAGPNVDTTSDSYLNGDVGLRNYFFTGDGTMEKPYEIVSPIHFYNLTRLQNIGVFSKKTYFQVGHIFDIEGSPSLKCINSYDSEGNPNYDEFLDMGPFCESNKVRTIGGEGVPFFGTIDGQGLPIKNLKVEGNPEDVGVFGYVAHEGLLQGLVFENLEVTSLGYNNNSSMQDYKLFSEDIDDIFHSASYLATDTKLSLYTYDSINNEYRGENLKKLNGSTGTVVADMNGGSNVYNDTMLFNGYFKATFPTNIPDDRFSYSMISSSPVIVKVGDAAIPGSSENDLTFDFTKLESDVDFNKPKPYQVNAKIYLAASVKVDGYIFSRVIQSYSVEIYNNNSKYSDGKYSCAIFCDYVDQGRDNDKVTGYHHGNNVGLLAGHVDGSLKDCFIFNGKLKFNETGYHPIAAETDTALVGEIGKNVKNDIDPDIGLVVNGDIGVMNFSKIYSMIRNNMTYPSTIKAGQRTPEGAENPVNYVSYKSFINNDTIDKFIDYLRYYDGKKEEKEFITLVGTDVGSGVWHDYNLTSNFSSDFNSVDFLWNKVIEDGDTEEEDRGLGVFKVVTSHNSDAAAHPESYGTYMVSNLGASRIINGTPKSKVYFSTAEFDHTKTNNFNWTSSTDDIPKRATDLPSYSDVLSFDYPFSRDLNYVFELDLSQMESAKGNDYMYNTDSQFLTNYLSSKLIDKYGDSVTPGSARFGFMFRSSENDMLTELSSYMPVGKPGSKQAFETTDGTKYYPSNSIVFRIENTNGANVSVVGNGEDITIYNYDPNTSEGGATPLYTMKSANTAAEDMHRYFTYDVSTGATATMAHESSGTMKDGGALYGHIFKLPQGDYVIGSNNAKTKANIYFLAVQGQNEGTIGANEIISIGDKIDGADFLLEAPTLANYPSGLNKASFTFKGLFNNTSGTIVTDVLTLGDKKYMRVTFNNSPVFALSMSFRSRLTEHVFMINEQLFNLERYDYTPS